MDSLDDTEAGWMRLRQKEIYGVRADGFAYTRRGFSNRKVARWESVQLLELLNKEDVVSKRLTMHGEECKNSQAQKNVYGSLQFFRAQALHYGLADRLRRNEQKQLEKFINKLLVVASKNGGQLIVPDRILQLEERLKKQYETSVDSLKADMKDKMTLAECKAERARLRRKNVHDLLLPMLPPGLCNQAKLNDTVISNQNPPIEHVALESLPATYIIAAPKMRDYTGNDSEIPQYKFSIKLAVSKSRHVWGKIDCDAFTGVLRSKRVEPCSFRGEPIQFVWRGHDTIQHWNGEHWEGSRFGSRNKVVLNFVNGNTFIGTMYWEPVGKFVLAGKKDDDIPGNRVSKNDIWEWKRIYRQTIQVGNQYDDPEVSDTTDFETSH